MILGRYFRKTVFSFMDETPPLFSYSYNIEEKPPYFREFITLVHKQTDQTVADQVHRQAIANLFELLARAKHQNEQHHIECGLTKEGCLTLTSPRKPCRPTMLETEKMTNKGTEGDGKEELYS